MFFLNSCMKMMRFFVFLLLLIAVGCSSDKQKTQIQLKSNAKKTQVDSVKDTLVYVNDCTSGDVRIVLEENQSRTTNTFLLTVKEKDGTIRKKMPLDARNQMSKLVYCTEDYAVVEFSCGGPCYAQIFVFLNENRPNEEYSFAQPIDGDDHLIAYIENEVFDTLVIRDLRNGVEERIDISDRMELYYERIDTLYVDRRDFVLRYLTKNNTLRTQRRTIK